jgi:hypothetical protein
MSLPADPPEVRSNAEQILSELQLSRARILAIALD